MKFLVLAMLLASTIAAPQLPVNSPIQAILLPSASSVSQSQQTIPAGAQVFYLQSQPQQISYVQGQGAPQGQYAFLQGGTQQGQVSYVQGPPQGQIIYLQSSPQQFSTVQTGAPQFSSFTTSVSQPQQASFTSFSSPPQQSSISSFTNSQSSQSSFSAPSPPTSSFSAPKPQPYRPVASPAPARPQPPTPSYSKPSQSYTGSPSPGTPGTPGEGGVYGYVTIKQSQDDDFDGNFRYNYETDHGIVVDVVGSVKNPGAEDQIQVIQGSYSYKNPDGTVITTTYTADENGFVAQGDHLPKEGPLPEAIAKALAYIASQPSTDE